MKQHITLEQVMNLTDEQVCKLNTLMNHEWNITQEQFEKNYMAANMFRYLKILHNR